jgi:hypothetical protein
VNNEDRDEITRLLDNAARRIAGLRTGVTVGTTSAIVALSVEDLIAAVRILVPSEIDEYARAEYGAARAGGE